METHELFRAIANRRFGKNTCFLCGKRLSAKNRTDEHVFPKWLQNRFGLWNRKVILLNSSEIAYRHLTIPCCSICNKEHLGLIEKRISKATKDGYEAVLQMDKFNLFVWLGKIFYGLLYKELFLLHDRKNKSKVTITNKELLKIYQMHHYFLQCARVPMFFGEFFPTSIGVFPTQECSNPRLNWGFRDDLNKLFISCRIGKVGIIATLQDGGALNHMFDLMNEIKQINLHPLQFNEIVAQCLYKASLFNRTPKYLVSETPQLIQVFQTPLQGLSSKSIYDEWNNRNYAIYLSNVTGIPLDKIFAPPNKVMTWLFDKNNKMREIDFEEFQKRLGFVYGFLT
jgi:hypothetical protein